MVYDKPKHLIIIAANHKLLLNEIRKRNPTMYDELIQPTLSWNSYFSPQRNPTHAEYELLTHAAAVGKGNKTVTVSGTGVPVGTHIHFGEDLNKRVSVIETAVPNSISATSSGEKKIGRWEKGKKKGGGSKKGGGRKKGGEREMSGRSDFDSDGSRSDHDYDSRHNSHIYLNVHTDRGDRKHSSDYNGYSGMSLGECLATPSKKKSSWKKRSELVDEFVRGLDEIDQTKREENRREFLDEVARVQKMVVERTLNMKYLEFE